MSTEVHALSQRLFAEGLGTASLVTTVVGSGIMAERLAGGNQAIALLGNTIPTGAILVVIITILGPISGAHFNPAITLALATRGLLAWSEVVPYVLVQCLGGIAGTALAHLMFDLAPVAIGTTARSGGSQWLAEMVATFTLVITIVGGLRYAPNAIPWLVGLTITAAYWFTSSTSFANPAVTLARGFTTTFSGIAIDHVPASIAAQLIGTATAMLVSSRLFPQAASHCARRSRPVSKAFSDLGRAMRRSGGKDHYYWRSRHPNALVYLPGGIHNTRSHVRTDFPFGHGQFAAKRLLDAVDELRKLTVSAI